MDLGCILSSAQEIHHRDAERAEIQETRFVSLVSLW